MVIFDRSSEESKVPYRSRNHSNPGGDLGDQKRELGRRPATSGPLSTGRRIRMGTLLLSQALHRSNRMVDHRAKNPIQHGGNQANIRGAAQAGEPATLGFLRPFERTGTAPVAVAAVRAATETIDRYPEPNSPRLVERLADFHGVPTEQIIVGAGTTELINVIGQMVRETAGRRRPSFGVPKPPAAHLVEPSYGEYRRTSA